MKRIRLASIVFAVAALAALALAASASATSYTMSLSFGSNGTGDGQFRSPNGIATDASGNVWVADTENSRIEEFNSSGKYLRKSTGGTGTDQLSNPADLAIDSKGTLWVVNTGHNRIEHLNSEGGFIGGFGEVGSGNGQLSVPNSIAIDSTGNFWVVDSGNERIQKFNSEGKYVSQFKLSFYAASITIDSANNLWLTDWTHGRLAEYNTSGTYLGQIGEGQLTEPLGDIVIDAEGNFWIADTNDHVVKGFSSKGVYLSQFGNPENFYQYTGLASAGAGSFWAVNLSLSRVEKWVPSAPNTTITDGSAGKVTPDVTFMFSSSEGGSTFECALDAGAYSACSSPKTYEVLAEGSHTFKVRAVKGGFVDPTPAERTVEVKEVAKAVSSIAILDEFARSENPLANGKWTKTSWAEEIGASWLSPWHGYGANGSHLAGAYWNGASFSDASAGILVSATVGTGPVFAGEYMSLWINMPNPGSARSGYEARFTGTNGTSSGYKVELSRWISGNRTELGKKENVSLPVGTTIVLTETGSKLNVWAGTSSFARVISAGMTNYRSGYAGIEANNANGTAYDFRAGNVK